MGYHEPDKEIVEQQQAEMAKTYFTLDAVAVWTLGLVKLSALFFYRRIFCNGPRDAFHVINIVSIVVVCLWIITFFTLNFSICGPHLTSLWDGGIPKCSRLHSYLEATAISDVILDFWIICLPLPNIWSLRTSIKRRIAISGVFLFALVGLGASTTRMVLFIYLITRGKAINDGDSYQTNTILAFFVILEAGLNIIAVNLPSLWYFVRGITADRVIRSMRSVLSLASGRRSQTSLGTSGATPKVDIAKARPSSSSRVSSNADDVEDRGDEDADKYRTYYRHSRHSGRVEDAAFESYALSDLPKYPERVVQSDEEF
ncbi:hypothetical protein PISL3812_03474 [Talaromyces islandicus]|uniref:Rhodopsin domain-containing protein n=1 Tax=Talaromyces islandicus TaxID=28573 RepID=A0A0U1LSV0_TALIS|nr:hypothetical protein PISL3812_03474 [Talaromyces islandicus]